MKFKAEDTDFKADRTVQKPIESKVGPIDIGPTSTDLSYLLSNNFDRLKKSFRLPSV